MASDPTMKIRGGGNPIANHGLNAGQKNGTPFWSQTLDAYDCIMVPIQDWIDRIQVCDPRGVTRYRLPGPSGKRGTQDGLKLR